MVPTLAGYISYLPALADIPPPSPPGCIPLPHIPADSISTEMELTAMINNYRQANDETALNLMPHLSQAARRHAWDMAENDFVDHVGSDGSSVGVRVHEACYEWLRIGQILGNAQDAESMLDSWIATQDNRQLILADEYKDFGVAYVNDPDSLYQNYWVVVFGRPVAAGQYIDQDHVP